MYGKKKLSDRQLRGIAKTEERRKERTEKKIKSKAGNEIRQRVSSKIDKEYKKQFSNNIQKATYIANSLVGYYKGAARKYLKTRYIEYYYQASLELAQQGKKASRLLKNIVKVIDTKAYGGDFDYDTLVDDMKSRLYKLDISGMVEFANNNRSDIRLFFSYDRDIAHNDSMSPQIAHLAKALGLDVNDYVRGDSELERAINSDYLLNKISLDESGNVVGTGFMRKYDYSLRTKIEKS